MNIFPFFKSADPQRETTMLKTPITYDTILQAIRSNRSDPMAGIGKWTADEELANDIFKRIKLADPARVADAPLDGVAQLKAAAGK